MIKHNIMIIGFGVVGQGFYDLFMEKKDRLSLSNVNISEIVDMRYGLIRDPKPNVVRSLKPGKHDVNVIEAIRNSDCDIVCEFTWVDYKTGGPGYEHIRESLTLGKNVLTTNKGPLALHFGELMSLARSKNCQLKFKGTVMAGTPSFNILELLPGIQVKSFRGILNGTTNYILTRMSQGVLFQDALKEAQSKGYAEADPTNDVEGYDSRAKCSIVSNVLGWKRSYSDVEVSGISRVSPDEAAAGVKLIAYADAREAYVKPVKLQQNDPLRHVDGVTNAIEFETDTLGRISVFGPGAGSRETAQAALTDLVSIISYGEG
ncbi:homoserine dehydrogenase [Thermoplasmatales archaeon AK]|nr:homoserine dehydrogenase [Thermoplasmatales archaeon AK]